MQVLRVGQPLLEPVMNAPTPGFDILAVKRRHRPLVGTSAIERLLLRKVEFVCPESRLCASVIKQAFVDLGGPSREARRDARRLFHDGRLEAWCELIGLNPEFVREVALKTGYLPAAQKGGAHA
jgi:hypothetical protein